MNKRNYITPKLQVEIIQLEQGIASGSMGGEQARGTGITGSLFESQVDGGEQTQDYSF